MGAEKTWGDGWEEMVRRRIPRIGVAVDRGEWGWTGYGPTRGGSLLARVQSSRQVSQSLARRHGGPLRLVRRIPWGWHG